MTGFIDTDAMRRRVRQPAAPTAAMPIAQTTDTVLMVRPAAFKANPETLHSNRFQKPLPASREIARQACQAFDGYVSALRQAGINVLVMHDYGDRDTPDSLFPNNWVATPDSGTLFTFPMEAHNRRRERRQDIIAALTEQFTVTRRIDLSPLEAHNLFLEGTGSLILDHPRRIAYACRSSRSSEQAGREFERLSGYHIHWFNARDQHLQPIYHTNVMLSVGAKFAIVCLASLASPAERQRLTDSLQQGGKTLIDVSFSQMEAFACNVLELKSRAGNPVYAMSTRAWQAFSTEQQAQIARYAALALAPIEIIEDLGGGGARCMLAEIFLQKRVAVLQAHQP